VALVAPAIFKHYLRETLNLSIFTTFAMVENCAGFFERLGLVPSKAIAVLGKLADEMQTACAMGKGSKQLFEACLRDALRKLIVCEAMPLDDPARVERTLRAIVTTQAPALDPPRISWAAILPAVQEEIEKEKEKAREEERNADNGRRRRTRHRKRRRDGSEESRGRPRHRRAISSTPAEGSERSAPATEGPASSPAPEQMRADLTQSVNGQSAHVAAPAAWRSYGRFSSISAGRQSAVCPCRQ
jgi:hypothetical protein